MEILSKKLQIRCSDNKELSSTKWYNILLLHSFRNSENNDFFIYVVVSGKHKKAVALDLSTCDIRELPV